MDPCSPSHEKESGTCIPKDCRSNQAVLNAAELAACRGAHLEGQWTRAGSSIRKPQGPLPRELSLEVVASESISKT